MTQNVNETEDEFFEEASEDFPSIGDLIVGAHSGIKSEVKGRLIAVWPRKNGTSQGRNGDPYGWSDAVVLVLDDGPDGTMFTDQIGQAPVEMESIRFSTSGTFSRIGPRLDGMTKPKRDGDGNIIVPPRPQKYLPLIGRLQAQPAKEKGNNPPIRIVPMTGSATEDADKAIALKFKAEILAISEKLKAKDAEVEDAAAFE
jgi:hypothetical protein